MVACSQCFRCVLNGGGDSTGAGCGASPPASGGRPGVFSCAGQGAEGGRGGQGGLVWNTPALAHMVSPLFHGGDENLVPVYQVPL